jgi:membrane carboxypeptidase/penicillin-binding protein
VLEQVITRGTGKRALRLGRPAGGKTGTTDLYKDSWFAGFTPQLSTVVWIGYPQPRPLMNIHGMPKVYGGSLPCEIWTRYMIAALAGQPVIDFPHVSLGGGDFGSSAVRNSGQPVPDAQPTYYFRRCKHRHCRP